jgi:ankyrin repeat protein
MGFNPKLEEAVLLGNLPLVQTLLKEGYAIDEKDNYGRTILYYAIVKGFTDIANELCLANTNVNNQDKTGKTPLHFVAIHYQPEIAKMLLLHGADVNLRDTNGNTPISDAVFNSKGNTDIIVLLKQHGADYNTPNNYGMSAKGLAESIANYDLAYLFE